MFGKRAQNYPMWLIMLAGAMLMPVGIHFSEGQNIVNDPNGYDIGFHAAAISLVILAMTSLLGPALAYSEDAKGLPAWTVGALFYAIGGLLAIFFVFGEGLERSSVVVMAYIPIVIFCLNTVLTFLIQTWAAAERAELPLWLVVPTHSLFALWTFLMPLNLASTTFITSSIVGVVVALIAAIPLAVIAYKRKEAEKARRQEFIGWQHENCLYN